MFKSVRLMLLMNRQRPSSRPHSRKKGPVAKPFSPAGGEDVLSGKRFERTSDTGITLYMLEYSEDGGKTWKVRVFTTPEARDDFEHTQTCASTREEYIARSESEEDLRYEDKER